MRTKTQGNRKLAVESAVFGLGYTAVLIWAGSALVGSFSSYEAGPYWPAIPHLRTDTAGVIAFGIAIVCLTVSRYLQLGRRGDAPAEPTARPAGILAVQAVAETAAVLGTALVAYLSLNAVTHPETLRMQLTHLWPWPSEGTVRVIALGITMVAVAVRRYLRTAASRPGKVTAVAERDDVATPDFTSRTGRHEFHEYPRAEAGQPGRWPS